jgi:parallel beta-helix repeat protein
MARTAGSGGEGIDVVPDAHHTTIRNGAINGFDQGVRLVNGLPHACILREIAVSGCAIRGIEASAGTVLENCRAHDNAGEGLIVLFGKGCVFVNCTATNNQGTSGINGGDGSTLLNCTASNNTGTYGISTGYGSVLTNCVASNNTCTYGIYGGFGSTLTNCAAYSNTSTAALSAGIGIASEGSASNCSSYANVSTAGATASNGMGFDVGDSCRIENCTANQNKGDGIRTGQSCTIRENHCAFNGNGGDGAGIHVITSACRIDSNNVLRNDRGIDVDGASNLIIRNNATGNTVNFDIVTSNHYGTIQNDAVGGAPAVIGSGTAATTVVTTDPWANISH